MTHNSTSPLSHFGRATLRALSVAAAALFATGIAVSLFHVHAEFAAGLRWTAIGLFVPFAVSRRSLLVWTFFAMLAGAELGVDAPQFAAQTRFLGEIFLRLIRMIVAFVIPTGYSFNMTGSRIYLSMAAIFCTQAAGIHLSVGQQIVMRATLFPTSMGVAGVLRATLVLLLATASSLQIPTTSVLMLLGVDTLMDMGRTAINIISNCLAAAVVGKWEGELKPGQATVADIRR